MLAGFNNTTGNSNTFVGYNAALNTDPAASSNLYISSMGALGESETIRIGDAANQTCNCPHPSLEAVPSPMSCAARGAMRLCRPPRRAVRLIAAWLVRGCWSMC